MPRDPRSHEVAGNYVDASASTGSLGRDVTYAWTATADVQDVTVAAALDDAADRADRVFELTGADIAAVSAAGGTAVSVVVEATNWLGASATSSPFSVAVAAGLSPTLTIIGGLDVSTTRAEPLRVMAEALATACDGRSIGARAVTYVCRADIPQTGRGDAAAAT